VYGGTKRVEATNSVVEMTRSASLSVLASEFDDFLFAPIGEDRNGMLLSVLSALARLDVDPWQEAAELARLPGETGTQRLASLIAALPDRPSPHLDPGTIAARLIALLPHRDGSNIPVREMLVAIGPATDLRAVIYMIFFFIFIASVLGAQSVLASRQPAEQIDNAHASDSSAVFPQIPPPSSNQ
jgi:hypothetical protein